ncbi:MAG TPA: hypothetical protein VH518_13540 [Tepidisphaeraceae bacterium]|jgi:hypothetical protein
MRNALRCFISSVAFVTFCTAVAQADPLPGRDVLKFQQKPLDNLTVIPGVAPFFGHDELSTAINTGPTVPYQGTAMADDFADKFSTPIVHVSWWGSYLDRQQFNGVPRFLISFESDVPASPTGGFSHPGVPLLAQVVNKGALAPLSGTFTETLVSNGGAPQNEQLYKYNAELALPFAEQPDTVYWLEIVALVNPTTDGAIQWGWHDRDYTQPDALASTPPAVNPGERNLAPASGPFPVWHFQDDAVKSTISALITPNGVQQLVEDGFAPQTYLDNIDGPPGIGQFSKDLAFSLYTVPEPACAGLLVLGAVSFLRRRKACA